MSNSYCEDVSSQTTEEPAEEDELWVVKGKATEFKGQCSHCHQYGHRLSEGLQKDMENGQNNRRTRLTAKPLVSETADEEVRPKFDGQLLGVCV